jgi:release factor glutamine methyltransferase
MTRDEQWLLDEKYGGDVGMAGFARDRARLAAGEPLAYVIGWQPFLGLRIHLDSHPLIPRPETEFWTEQALAEARSRHVPETRVAQADGPSGGDFSAEKYAALVEGTGGSAPPLNILDLCAGSGAIGCAALARLPGAPVAFGEIDPAHAPTIERNIRENGLDAARADIRVGDLFAPFAGERFDYILCNPPYIPAERALPESVADHEPRQALFAGSDGLALIRRIATGLADHLAPGGEAWIEIDSAAARSAAALFTDQGLAAIVRPDQYGRPRVLVVRSI